MKGARESDWKKFRAMIPKVRERYVAQRNARIASMLTDSKKTETERFWDAMEAIEQEAKILCHCLDGHSRSKMGLFIISMIRCQMLTKDDLAEFSDELRSELEYVFDEK